MSRVKSIFNQHRFFILLFSLLLLLVLTPILNRIVDINLLLNGFVSFTILTGVSAFSKKRSQVLIGLILALPFFIDMWTGHQIPYPAFKLLALCFGILFYFYIIFLLLTHILKRHETNIELIYASLSGFLLFGFAWSLIYTLIAYIEPSSFNGISIDDVDLRYHFVYFSYVTLSTLGYGDITPAHPVAQSWCVLEAVIGQMYMVVLVAGLVGRFTSRDHDPTSS